MADNEKTIVECRCGRCGRVTGVSDVELRAHGGEVVCPVCLNHIVVEGYNEVSSPLKEGEHKFRARYCFNCGERLPGDIHVSYCPYCGVRVAAIEAGQGRTVRGIAEPGDATPPNGQAKPRPYKEEGLSGEDERPTPHEGEADDGGKTLDTISFLPSSFIPAWMDEPQRRASLRFHIFAGVVIVALLVTLGLILNAITTLP